MYISDLNTFSGELGSNDYFATDNGTDTAKVSAKVLLDAAADEAETIAESAAALREVLVIDVASFSALPKTLSNSNITSDMVVINSVLGTPSAQTSDWTVTTAAGSLTISGSISGSTTLTLYLGKSR